VRAPWLPNFASYIARSAFRSSSSAESPSSGNKAIPMLALIVSCRSRYTTGSFRAWSSVPATICASWRPGMSSRIAINSSPPTRATVSLSRSLFESRSATCRRTESPAECPCTSLICLNLFRSIHNTAIDSPFRLARRIAVASRSCRAIDWGVRSNCHSKRAVAAPPADGIVQAPSPPSGCASPEAPNLPETEDTAVGVDRSVPRGFLSGPKNGADHSD
jgi:hypothetical protein